jgi:hypothetical protein
MWPLSWWHERRERRREREAEREVLLATLEHLVKTVASLVEAVERLERDR